MNVKTFKFLFINDPITICSNNVHLIYPTIKIIIWQTDPWRIPPFWFGLTI